MMALDEQALRAEIRAEIRKHLAQITREAVAQSAEEREVRLELAKAGSVALNARAAACFNRLVKRGMDRATAGEVVLRAVQSSEVKA